MSTKKIHKTNAMRQLDSAGIRYEYIEYSYDENDLSGNHVAEELKVPENQIFKTLVTRVDNNLLSVFVVPVSKNLDLKKAAKVSNNKKVEMIHVKEIQAFTGYIRGGCSPIGMKKLYPTYIDISALNYKEIYVSAGKRGLQLIIEPKILASFVNASFCEICTD